MSTICKVFIRYLSLFLKAPRTENGNLTFGSYLLRRRFFFRVTDMVFTLFALLHLCVKTKIFYSFPNLFIVPCYRLLRPRATFR